MSSTKLLFRSVLECRFYTENKISDTLSLKKLQKVTNSTMKNPGQHVDIWHNGG